jgi:hypothetical protein
VGAAARHEGRDRGRIPAEVLDAYHKENGGDVRRGSGTATVILGAG